MSRKNGMQRGRAAQHDMQKMLDELAEFEDFKAHLSSKVAKDLIKDVKSGMSAKALREKYAAFAQARQIAIALSTEDDGKADAAAQRLLDRVEGKATETKRVKHQFEDMSDEELEAILRSEEEDLKDMEDRFNH